MEHCKLELLTAPLFCNGSAVQVEHLIQQRRQKVLDKLEYFGGVSRLIESTEKYHVYYSEAVYKLFCAKYQEIKGI